MQFPYKCYPIGDSGLTVEFGDTIDTAINEYVLSLFHYFRKHPLPGVHDVVPAYSTLSFHYHIYAPGFSNTRGKSCYETLYQKIKRVIDKHIPVKKQVGKNFQIPVCYDDEFALDMNEVSSIKKLSIKEIIRLHTSVFYRVYMNGFLPGFPYMGKLDSAIGVARKSSPRKKVPAGSVGLAGLQTGIYPLESPGGWQIIGRTPLKIFDKKREQPALLQPGDSVQFFSITKDEFENYEGRDT